MNKVQFQGLVVETLRNPAGAAEKLLSLNLPRQFLWMAMALMCVLNAIVYSIAIRINVPEDPNALSMIPPAFQSPVLFTMFLFGALVITVFVLQWIGQTLQGEGSVGDILVLIVWLQVMRLLFQVSILVISLVFLPLSAILVIAGSVYAIYILSAFIDKAHKFDNLLKALGVIVVGIVSIIIGASLILSVIAAVILGGTGSV